MTAYSVNVPPRVVAAIRRHAVATAPAECCGALMGGAGDGRIDVRAVVPLENASSRPDRYLIDARAVLRLERQASRAGFDVVGFYHSHPRGPAAPSATDLELASPGYVYLIVDVCGATVRAWRLRDRRDGFAELPVGLLAGAA
jgi:proteasome lid subunit RPN8/RPN11